MPIDGGKIKDLQLKYTILPGVPFFPQKMRLDRVNFFKFYQRKTKLIRAGGY
jgi:hypothetical protein